MGLLRRPKREVHPYSSRPRRQSRETPSPCLGPAVFFDTKDAKSTKVTKVILGVALSPPEQAGVQPSMSLVACPWDNAMAEGFMKTLKNEEVDGRPYRDLAEAAIGGFVETVYNRPRLHSALAHHASEVFEASQPPVAGSPVTASGPAIGFFRHSEIYRDDGAASCD